MILVVALVAVIAAVPLWGGRLSGLNAIRFRWAWAAGAAIGVQVLMTIIDPTALTGPPADAAHVATCLLAAGFVVANRKVRGLWLIALGGASNLIAIAANGGVMPASASALRRAGRPISVKGFTNSAVVPHSHLAFLGDVFDVPKWLPLSNVFSAGDVVLVAGTLWMTVAYCRRSGAARSAFEVAQHGQHPAVVAGGGGQVELREDVGHVLLHRPF